MNSEETESSHTPITSDDSPNRGLAEPSFEREVSAWSQLKIARAVQHIKDLEARVNVWASGKPFTTKTELTPDRLKWYTKMHVSSPPPVFEWSLIMGDCVHSLRGALDACVWELAHLNGATPPAPHRLQFPIITDKNKWARARLEQLQTVPDEIASRIEVLQPFNRSADEIPRDALLCLSRLNNIDKHRSNIAVSVNCDRIKTQLTVGWDSPGVAERNVPPQVTYYSPDLVDGAVVMELTSLDPISHTKGGCSLQFVFTAETATGRENLFTLTGNLIQYVQQIRSGLLGGLVKEDSNVNDELKDESGWKSMDMVQDGNVYRSVNNA
jgi:hypothetical protein